MQRSQDADVQLTLLSPTTIAVIVADKREVEKRGSRTDRERRRVGSGEEQGETRREGRRAREGEGGIDRRGGGGG